jgi:predicted TIM-barrel fold metal-dependent hydrolase
MSKQISRRKFFSNTVMSAAGLMVGAGINTCKSKAQPVSSSFDIMREVMKYRKIDAHAHINFSLGDVDKQLDFADRLGIEKLSISRPITGNIGTHEEVIMHNNLIIKAIKSHPDRFIGFFTLIPTFAKESLEEIKRCVDSGMSGYKGYLQVKVNDPSYYPVIEKLIDHKMICFMHAYSGIGRGGYRTKYGNLYPNESTPEDFIDISTRYPQAIFQWAHLGAGGDWEYQCKALKDYPNIYADTSGSNNAGNLINYALKYFGEDRLLFGSDLSYYQSVSKILAADLNESQRKKIFFDNYNNLLKKGGYNVA